MPLSGTGAKLIARISARDQHDREDAAEVVDRLGRLVDVRRARTTSAIRSATTASGSVMRKTEPHRSARAARRRRAGRATRSPPPSADHSAIDFVRPGPGPQRGDQRQRRRVGHAGREPAEHARGEEHAVGRRERGEQARRDRQRHAEQQHQLAPVAVAERAEVEHRGGEAERVADRDQVERRLRRVEVLADRRQRDVGDRQVQVRDAGDEDQRDEDEARAAPVPWTPVSRSRQARSYERAVTASSPDRDEAAAASAPLSRRRQSSRISLTASAPMISPSGSPSEAG